jgi:hypothetical protein
LELRLYNNKYSHAITSSEVTESHVAQVPWGEGEGWVNSSTTSSELLSTSA